MRSLHHRAAHLPRKSIVINIAPTINGTKLSAKELLDVLNQCAYEAEARLRRERERKERTVLS